MSERITIGDIEAFLDVLALISEQSDDFDLAHTTAVHRALAGAKAKIDETMSLLDTRLRQLADGATTLASTEGTVKVMPFTVAPVAVPLPGRHATSRAP